MIKKLFHSKRFVFGIMFFTFLISSSFLFSMIVAPTLQEPVLIRTLENGTRVAAPFTPEVVPPFGTNRSGDSVFYQIIEGGKYTLLIVFGVITLQVFVATVLGVIYGLYLNRLKKLIKYFLKVFHYIPILIFGYLFMLPIMWMSKNTGLTVNIILSQVFVLLIITVPTLSVYIGEEISLFLQKDYIVSAKLLGASKIYIFRKHIWLFLREQLVIVFIQQSVQLLLFLTYLSFFGIFIGGAKSTTDFDGGVNYFSLSNEWAGLIGLERDELFLAPWIVLAPLIMFAIVIFVLNIMGQGAREALESRK